MKELQYILQQEGGSNALTNYLATASKTKRRRRRRELVLPDYNCKEGKAFIRCIEESVIISKR